MCFYGGTNTSGFFQPPAVHSSAPWEDEMECKLALTSRNKHLGWFELIVIIFESVFFFFAYLPFLTVLFCCFLLLIFSCLFHVLLALQYDL